MTRLPRTRIALLPLLGFAIVAACVDDPELVAPDAIPIDDEPELAASNPQVVVYMRPVTIERTGGPRQIVALQLDTLPISRVTGPFRVHVVKQGDSLRGSVAVDSIVEVRLAGVASNDTASREALVGAQSVVIVELAGGRGSVTLWITAVLDPSPTITIRSPRRGSMILSASMDSSNVIIRGTACHPHRPITSLVVAGVDFEPPGTRLCEEFAVARRSGWGVNTFTVVARTAHGRERTVIHSFLRSPLWLPISSEASPAFVPFAIHGNLFPVHNGNDAAFPSDLREVIVGGVAALSLDPYMPDVVLDTEPAQPRCDPARSITRRGYRVLSLPANDQGRSALFNTTPTGLFGAIDVDSARVPLRVITFEKTSCQAVKSDTTFGSVTVAGMRTSRAFALSVADGRLVVTPGTSGVSTIGFSTTLGRASYLPAAAREELLAALPPALDAAVRAWGPALDAIMVAAVAALLPAYGPTVGDGGAALGIGSRFDVDSVRLSYLPNSWLDWGFAAFPLAPRTGTAPARGAIRRGTGTLPPPPSGFPPAAAISDDALNAMLWAAWQAGYFDIADVMSFGGGTPASGIRTTLRASLPPVITQTDGSSVLIRLNDVRVSSRINPSIWGRHPAGTPNVTTVTYVDFTLVGTISMNPATGLPSFTATASAMAAQPHVVDWPVLSNLNGARTQIVARTGLFLSTRLREVFAAVPLPAATFDAPGLGTLTLAIDSATTSRAGGFQNFTGSLAPQ